jgi:hypothetical protein
MIVFHVMVFWVNSCSVAFISLFGRFGLITIPYVLMVGVHNHLFDHSIWVVAFDLPCPIVFDLPFLGSVQLSAIECQRSSFLHILVHMEGFIKPWEG